MKAAILGLYREKKWKNMFCSPTHYSSSGMNKDIFTKEQQGILLLLLLCQITQFNNKSSIKFPIYQLAGHIILKFEIWQIPLLQISHHSHPHLCKRFIGGWEMKQTTKTIFQLCNFRHSVYFYTQCVFLRNIWVTNIWYHYWGHWEQTWVAQLECWRHKG